jgi:hypothetical protein
MIRKFRANLLHLYEIAENKNRVIFGNKLSWILDAIEKSVKKFKNTHLNMKI